MAEKKPPMVTGRFKEYIGKVEDNSVKKDRIVLKQNEMHWIGAENESKKARMICRENGFDITLHVLSLIELEHKGLGGTWPVIF